jgi:hypothetical protein
MNSFREISRILRGSSVDMVQAALHRYIYLRENLSVEGKIGANTKIMVLPSKYVARIEFSGALLYKLLAQTACVLAVPNDGSLATPHTRRY